jgi:hypothetical protein
MKVIWTQEEAYIDALAGKKDYVLGATISFLGDCWTSYTLTKSDGSDFEGFDTLEQVEAFLDEQMEFWDRDEAAAFCDMQNRFF